MSVSTDDEINFPYDRIAQVYNGQAGSKYSQERAKARIDWIISQTRGNDVIDIGCSEGIIPLFLSRKGFNVVAVDINPKSIDFAKNLLSSETEETKSKVKFLVFDILEFDSQENKFDTVILGEIIEHFDSPQLLIEKATSLMKPDGRIIITTPFGYFPDPDHRQTFTIRSFLSLVANHIAIETIQVVDGYIRCVGNMYQPLSENSAKYNDEYLLNFIENAAIDEQKRYHRMVTDQYEELRKLTQEKNLISSEFNKIEIQFNKISKKNHEFVNRLNKIKLILSEKEKQNQSLSGTIIENQKQIDNLQNEISCQEVDYRLLKEKYISSFEEAKKNRDQLSYYMEQFQKYRNAYIDMENSVAYRVGDLLKQAITHPGVRTLLFPIEIIKLFIEGLERIKKRKSIAPLGEVDNRQLLIDPQLNEMIIGTKDIRKKSQAFSNFILSPDITHPNEMRIASIMDAFTFHSFKPECHLMQIEPGNWKEQLEQFKPHMFFLESAWQGKDSLWYRQIDKISPTLQEVISWCNNEKIPVIFWNKEDPVHFNSFIRVAALCDYIFTTDIELIPQYKAICGHNRVYLLPFAAQTKIHNPIEKYNRKNAFCFAGAYYAHFSERVQDLEMIFNSLSSHHPFEIFDRNAYPDNPNYQFPEKYRASIQGTLTADEIDRAYKGYKYGINLNTIKQSQTMFARRVYELLASNTLTFSNYARGIRNLFGDLVVCSDNSEYLQKWLQKISVDDTSYRKFRLAGLRKVLQNNTYQDRLNYIVNKVFNVSISSASPTINCIAFVKNDTELYAIISSYETQSYSNKKLHLFSDTDVSNEATNNLPNDCSNNYGEVCFSEEITAYIKNGFVALLNPEDYYGKNYLIDLSLATRYTDAKIIGKSVYYTCDPDGYHLNRDGDQYLFGKSIPFRSGMISIDLLKGLKIDEIRAMSKNPLLEGTSNTFSIDEFNYCQNFIGEKLPEVDDLLINDSGIDVQELQKQAEKLEPIDITSALIYPNELKRIFSDVSHYDYEINFVDGALDIFSRLERDKHIYIYSKMLIDIKSLDLSKDSVCLFSAAGSLDLSLVLFWLSKDNEKLGSMNIDRYKSTQMDIPEGTKNVQIGLRIKGKGQSSIKSIKFSKKEAEKKKTWVGKSDILLLTNIYPSYDDLYRNAFVHRRVLGYCQEGVNVDVLRFSTSLTQKYYEFQGVDVSTGGEELLESLLSSGQYKKVLVHFLDQGMWTVLKKYLDHLKVIIWIHGSEIQPWWRREFNYRTIEEKNQAIYESTIRQNYWNEVFAHDQINLHFVFVSKYMANEVVEDYKIQLENINFSIIHNLIDTNLFIFQSKNGDQRKRILTIRPFASNKYANDLSVKAIQVLAEKPFFKDLEFKIIGQGELFEETVAPLRKFPNISLEQRFLNQQEIAELHKGYGIFLCPTRMDAQGVSRDEAMASGLVPITNNVAAIPEFVDDTCGILAPAEDHMGLAMGIEELYQYPELFLKMSKAAANRVQNQSSYDYTILNELKLIFDR